MELDEFRITGDDEPDEFDELFGGGDDVVVGREIGGGGSAAVTESRGFLGMSAGERAFLSVMLFFNVLILGILLLIVTERIAL